MSTVTSEIQERVDELVALLQAFAERHGVETCAAPNLAEQVAQAMLSQSMTLDEVIEVTRTTMIQVIKNRSQSPRNRARSPVIQ